MAAHTLQFPQIIRTKQTVFSFSDNFNGTYRLFSHSFAISTFTTHSCRFLVLFAHKVKQSGYQIFLTPTPIVFNEDLNVQGIYHW